MKKTVSFIAAALIALSLVACNDNDSENTEDWRIVSLYQMVEPDKNGMFISNTYESLSFLDFSTMQQAPVCDDPTCKHEADSYNSYGKNNHPFLYNDKLYYVKTTDFYQEGEEFFMDTQLWQSDVNGANEKQITEIKGLVYYDYDRMLIYGDTIYMCMLNQPYNSEFQELEPSVELVSCNLDSGEITNYGEVVRSYSGGSWVCGLWDGKMIFQTSKPVENLPYMEKVERYIEENNLEEEAEKYAEENNVTIDVALMHMAAGFQDEYITEYLQLDLDSGEISLSEYPEPQAISPYYYYYLDNDKLMFLDSEGEEHELEGLEGEITRVTALNDYTYINAGGVTYLFNEPEQELTKLDEIYDISAVYDDSIIISYVTDSYSLAYDKKAIEDITA